MLKAIIVDDEILTVRALRDQMLWRNHGIEIVGTAYDGEQAYQLVLTEKPEIVITDIRLPKMDGLKLTELIKQTFPEISVILISAFADFEYAQRAIKIGGDGYLLKPIDEYELEAVIQQIKLRLTKAMSQQRSLDRMTKQKNIQNLWMYIKEGTNLKTAEQALSKLEIQNVDEYWLIHFVLDCQAEREFSNNCANLDFNPEYYSNCLETIMERYGEVIPFGFEKDYWTGLVKGKGIIELLLQDSNPVKQYIDESQIPVICSFVKLQKSLAESHKSYQKLEEVCRYGVFLGINEWIIPNDYFTADLSSCKQLSILQHDISEAIKSNDMVRARYILQQGIKLAEKLGPENIRIAYEFCYAIWQTLRTLDIDMLAEERFFNFSLQDLYEYQTLEELKEASLEILNLADQEDKMRNKSSSLFDDSLEYINQHYGENISLDTLSKRSGISKNYYCFKFKRETGKNIWTYLTEIRIEHSKQLLKDGNMRIYEVAYQVGYDNPSYFSKQFKSLVGISPQEYIQKMANEGKH